MSRPRLARDVLVDCLLAEGVDAVFGNPGTTELPLMEALAQRDAPAYYLGLQETVCLGMADGYAQATGRPAVVNLHASPGLGNAMGNLFNAWRGRTPLVVTAGQQDTRFDLDEPLLHSDLVRQASQYTKWAWELKRPEQVPGAVRRAFKEASSPPVGPVFMSLPMDLLNQEV
ncbi:MAG: thiamine pyrophosphate-binding protein, partial [Actinomycetota bacterium]